MALVKLSPEIKTIRGRFGGVYFKRDNAGQHVQAMPRVWHYPRTTAQKGSWGWGSPFAATGSAGFSGGALFWAMALVGFFAVLWAAFALIWLYQTIKGDKKRITGYNWYMHFALGYPEAERPPLWKPPKTPTELPEYIAVYRETWSYEHQPDIFPPECPTAYYYQTGFFNGENYYTAPEEGWELWWKGPIWVLSPGRAQEPAGKTYYSEGAEAAGIYIDPIRGISTHVSLGYKP